MSSDKQGVPRILGGATTASIADQFSLKGMVGLVAGGAGALGLESVMAMVEAGARVYAMDIVAPEKLSDEFKTCQAFAEKVGTVLEYVQGDITDTEFMQQICKTVGDKEGRFDLCVLANGWLHKDTPVLDLPVEVWEKSQRINATGTFVLAQAAAREMKARGNGGSIVIYASLAGIRVQKSSPSTHHSWAGYAASKATTQQITRQLAMELAKENIRVNSISPGQIRTPICASMLDADPVLEKHWTENNNPFHRLGRPDEMRGAVVFLCSPAASCEYQLFTMEHQPADVKFLSTDVTGIDLVVDGGMLLW
ncbi:hypothetical protein MNV49_001747 [Pseudohyphozyma bogoriensis]|nr:hypothetical protein MNV49_001747 [Pseudohyphozyma bogoriensis]